MVVLVVFLFGTSAAFYFFLRRKGEEAGALRLENQKLISSMGEIREGFELLEKQVKSNLDQIVVLDQMATTLEELSLGINQSAGRVQSALQVAQTSHDSAKEGDEAVQRIVSMMTKIAEMQRGISGLNDEVENIAYESRIVSLNSLIEAARAKEHGASFMVVAKRVQEMSNEIIESAAKIKNFVAESDEGITQGQDRASAASSELTKITKTSSSVAKLMTEISVAIQSQAESIEDLSKMLSDLREEVQSTAYRLDRVVKDLSIKPGGKPSVAVNVPKPTTPKTPINPQPKQSPEKEAFDEF